MAEQRLINAEELLNEMQLEYAAKRKLIEQGKDHLNSLAEGYFEVHQLIKNMPTIDPESLRPVGRWEYKPDMYDNNTYECSECGCAWTIIDGTPADNDMLYCPHCGAKNPESNVGKMEVQDDD